MKRTTFAPALPLAVLLGIAVLAARGSGPPPTVVLTVHGASISRTGANGDARSRLAANVPPDSYFEVFVEGSRVHSSGLAVNTWEPQWNESCSFPAREGSAVSLAVYEADPGGGVRLLGRWEGTLSSLERAAGRLRFGPIRKLSYTLRPE